MIALSENHPEVTFVAVAMQYDPPNRALQAYKELRVPYSLAMDVTGSIARKFGDVAATPTTFLLDQYGRVRYTATGAIDRRDLNRVLRNLDKE